MRPDKYALWCLSAVQNVNVSGYPKYVKLRDQFYKSSTGSTDLYNFTVALYLWPTLVHPIWFVRVNKEFQAWLYYT